MEITTHNDFITQIENYYSLRYANTFETKLIQDYLRDHFNEQQLTALFFEAIQIHSKKWKSLPDIAVFQEIIKTRVKPALEIKAEKAWLDLLQVSSKDDVLIADPVSHTVVSGYGSWSYFCEERDNNREWTHKAFLIRYTAAAEFRAYEEPRRLAGQFRVSYGSNFKGVTTTIIGNIEEGKRMLEEPKNSKVNSLLGFIERV